MPCYCLLLLFAIITPLFHLLDYATLHYFALFRYAYFRHTARYADVTLR